MTEIAQQLRDFKSRLQEREEALHAMQRELEALREVVSGLEKLAASASGEPQPAPPKQPQPEDVQDKPRREAIRGRVRRGLPGVLREIMADGVTRHVTQIECIVAEHPKFADAPPARNTISNRLHDLVNDGYVVRVKRGTYKLASQNGSASSVAASGTDKAEPDSGVIPLDGEDLGPARPVGLIDPPGGA